MYRSKDLKDIYATKRNTIMFYISKRKLSLNTSANTPKYA